jgi:putative flippase GtrA
MRFVTREHGQLSIIAVETRRFLRACLVALLAFVTFMAAGLGLRHIAGLGETSAAMIAAILTLPISYFGHALLTFGVGPADRTRILRFVGLTATTLAITWAIANIGVKRGGLPYWLGLLTTTTVVPLINYLFLRLYVFMSGTRSGSNS